ncbi:MAG TPA: hypothetical protein VIN09_08020, partial [Chloroflexota bacterium]
MSVPRSISIALYLAVLLVALARPADAAETIAGRVVRGSESGPPLEGTTVTLRLFDGERLVEERRGTASADGSFAFAEVPSFPDREFQVVVPYDGVTYESDRLPLDGAQRDVSITVYAATHEDAVLQLRSVTVVLGQVDASHQRIHALELVTVENASRQTFAPAPPGEGGRPMGFLRFPLPPLASDLTARGALEGVQLLQVDAGFGAPLAVPPGQFELAFSYQFPYNTREYLWSRAWPYPVASLQVLVPEGSAVLESSDLAPGGTMEIAGRTLHVYRAQDIPRGATVAFRLRGLPVPGAFGLPYEEGTARVVALALAGAGVLVALRRAVRGRGPRSSP